MKNRYLFASLGLLACLGVSASAQVVLNTKPTKVFGQAFLPTRAGEMVYPPSFAPNRTKAKSLYSPYSVAVDTSSSPAPVYVADTGNNRVLGWRDSAGFVSGAPADLVIGQKDFDSATPYGVGIHIVDGSTSYDLQVLKDYGSGLHNPSSVLYRGDFLFVMDAGNNRILRFRRPFESLDAGTEIQADLVIGQPDLKSNLGNLGAASPNAPTASSIRTNGTGTGGIQAAGMAFDADGNLWLADSGNHRILRYTAADVFGSSNVTEGSAAIAADLVLGQSGFTTAVANTGKYSSATDIISKTSIRYGGPIAFDSAGNLYFADDMPRVLVWKPPFSNGKTADRILGIYVAMQGQTAPPSVNDLTFGFTVTGTTTANAVYVGGPRGLFCIDDNLFVIDSLNNRIVRFDPLSSWPIEDRTHGVFSPHMAAVYGQGDFNSRFPNTADYIEPNTIGFNYPVGATYANGELYVAEVSNHRVTARPFDSASRTFGAATRVLGQLDFTFRAPNFAEGGEFSGGVIPVLNTTLGPSLAIDRVSSTPHLYIADTGNHRILCFADARTFNGNSRADIVIGQVDPFRVIINSPTNNPATPGTDGLYLPGEVAVDAQGNLWVSDTGNGSVLRYPNPFERTDGLRTPDLVLGQTDFTTPRSTGGAARDRMGLPVGLAFTPEGNLAVADMGYHRVLLFKQPSISGQTADTIFGQPDGATATAGSSAEQLNSPRGIAIDSFGHLFVADTGNSRIQVWYDINNAAGDGATAPYTIKNLKSGTIGTPLSVTIDPTTEAIWVADGGTLSRVLRFPNFANLLGAEATNYDFVLQVLGPRRIALDRNGNPLVVDAANRITMYHPALSVQNAANGFGLVAPAMLGLIRVPGVTLTSESASASGSPLPVNLGDLEVLVNGVNAPLTKVTGETATIIIPKGTPGSGTADFLLRQVSTGQVLAFSRISMTPLSPGILFQSDTILIEGQARAINQDGSANSTSNPAKIDQELTVFLTGHGNFDGLPDDGVAPGGEVPVPGEVLAYFATSSGAARADVLSSTLDPDTPGVWRVKVKVPTTLSGGAYIINMAYNGASALKLPGAGTIQVRPLVTITR